MGTLFFVSLIVGAIPAQAKTDPATGMRVTKPYFFVAPGTDGAVVTKFGTSNPLIVNPDDLKIRVRLNFEQNYSYSLSIFVNDNTVPSSGFQTINVWFNGSDVSVSPLVSTGTIDLSNLDGVKNKMLTNPDVKIKSSGWLKGRDLSISITLMKFNTMDFGAPPVTITQTGMVRTSSR